MAIVSRRIAAPLEVVFDTLRTPESYPHWLIGAREIRDVDDGWPEPGTRFHHTVGLGGPPTPKDSDKVLDITAPVRLSLEVRARPFGRGRATFELAKDGDDAATTVTLDEVPIGLMAPTRPLIDPLTVARNKRTLANLAGYIEHGESQADPPA
jgi:uncharacterized protein YndB with AHSA1/START domain